MTSSSTYDVVILGGGSGGYAAALRSAQLGKSVALIEQDKIGGTCLHRGCIPTKALLHAAEVASVAKEGPEIGINTQLNGIDMSGVNAYKEGVVGRLYKGLQGLVKAAKITLIDGHGELTSPSTVQVGEQTITGSTVILATGSYSKTLPGLEISGRIMTSEQALALTEVPRRAIIVGGGVIGVEFASVWNSFGTEVTIVEALPRLVPGEQPASSKILERTFRKRGITMKTGTKFASATSTDTDVTLTLESGETLSADLLLVAVGRGPVTANLGYEQVGIAMDRGFVTTDDRLRTNVAGVYAVGDIVPGLQLAHRGFAHGIFVAEDLSGLNPMPIVDTDIPRVTYCDPEVASVGLTQEQAEAAHGADAVTSYEYNLAGNGKSQILGTAGIVTVVGLKDGPVVGIHMVGARVGELIGEAQLIVNWEATAADVAHLIHAHPTQGEALGEAHLALAGKPLHAHA